MTIFKERGKEIRELCKSLVLEFMSNTSDCQTNGKGMKQAEIFRACGFDFGTYEKVTSSNQQYWIVAILRQLESEKKSSRSRNLGHGVCAAIHECIT